MGGATGDGVGLASVGCAGGKTRGVRMLGGTRTSGRVGPRGHQVPEVCRGTVGLAGARDCRDRAGGRQARVVRRLGGIGRAGGARGGRGDRDPGPTH